MCSPELPKLYRGAKALFSVRTFTARLKSCPDTNLVRFSGPLHIGQIDAFLRHFVQRRKFAQALDGFNDTVGYVVDLGSGVEAADAETDRTVRQVVAGAQSLQYIRWFQSRRGACRTAGNCNIVDAHQKRFAFHVGEADVQVAGKAMLHGAVDISFVETVQEAMAQALPKPTMPATLSVPERMPRSWPPPSMMAEICTRGFLRRTYKAPTPLGPYILWAEIDITSMFCLFTSIGILPMACVASVWKIIPRSRQSLPISAMGCTTPISLFAAMMLTRMVLSSMARFSSSRSTRPSFCTGR